MNDFSINEETDDRGELDLQVPVHEEGKPEISELSQRGYLFLKESRIEDAEDCFRKILAIEPENNYALVGLGDAARKQGKHPEATRYYERCLRHHPGNNYALFGLADCYKASRHYTKAIEIWEQYLQHDDKNITVLTRVADAYRKVRNLNRSRDIYLKVLSMERDNPYALIGLGHLYYDFKEYDKALFYWERMVQVHGSNVDIRVLTSVGNCHRKLKTFRKGIDYFARALELEPDNFYALFGMADCYRGLNLHKESLHYWNRILASDPDNKVILTRAGDAYRSMGEYDDAEVSYKKALNIEFDAYAILGLALIYKQKGKYQEAIESLEGLLKNDTKNSRLYLEIADCYIRLDLKKKAFEVLTSFQNLGIRNSYISEMYEILRKDLHRT
jgi:tetratricopeptide (TPR) repeat protein